MVVLTSDYSLAGIRLFSSEEDLVSQLPTEELRRRFLNISQLVSTYENFAEASSIERILKLDFTSSMLNSAPSVSLVTSILTNTNFTAGSCASSNSSTNFFSTNYSLRKSNINNDLGLKIIQALKSQLELLPGNIDPIGSGVNIQAYRNIMIVVCTEIWKFHYEKLQSFLAASSGTVSLPVISSFDRYAGLFCEYVRKNINRNKDLFYSDSCQEDTYFKAVHDLLMNYTKTSEAAVDTIQSDPKVMRMFLSCFYPYFLYDYILNNIALQNMDSLDKAPRYFILRRFAVLAAYMSLFYVAYSVRDTDPYTAKLVLAKINDDLFAKEMSNNYNGGITYADVHQDTTQNANMSKDLNRVTQDVTASRGNLNKALNNDVLINSQLHRSHVVKYIWVALLIITALGCIALYFLAIYSFVDSKYLFMFVAIMFVVLMISGIVNFAKKFEL
jgi:hypothetical protein